MGWKTNWESDKRIWKTNEMITLECECGQIITIVKYTRPVYCMGCSDIVKIDNRIKEACGNGKTYIINPEGSLNFMASDGERKAVRLHYENQGFKWIEHKVPASNDPREHDWIELKW